MKHSSSTLGWVGMGWGWVGVKIWVLPKDRWLGGWLDPDENNASLALAHSFFPQGRVWQMGGFKKNFPLCLFLLPPHIKIKIGSNYK